MALEQSSPTLLHITNVPEQLRCFLGGQVRYMKSRGLKVQIISSPGPLLEEFADNEKVPVHAVPMTRKIAPLRDLISVLLLWLKIRSIRPDIVHAHSPKGGLLAMIAAWFARTPVRIYHIRGLPFTTAAGLKRRMLCWTERLSCFLAHEVYCVSHSMRRIAISEGFVRSDKVKVFCQGSGNGVDASGKFCPSRFPKETSAQVRKRFGIPSDTLVLGFVGRVGNDKGITELVEAWLELRDRHPSLRMLVVGPLETKDAIPEHIERTLRNDERIHLAGVEWNTGPLYAAMDIVVLPSYREGLPNVPLEAAAMECPVVATRIPGCTDAIEDGVTGQLVPPRDSASLAQAIQKYVLDTQLRIRHGQAGRKRVLKDFQPQAIWEATHKSYGTICNLRKVSWNRVNQESPFQKKAA